MPKDKLFSVGLWTLIAGIASPYLTVLAFHTVLPPGFMFSIFFGAPCYIVGLILVWLSAKTTTTKVLLTVLPFVGTFLCGLIWGLVLIFRSGLGAPR